MAGVGSADDVFGMACCVGALLVAGCCGVSGREPGAGSSRPLFSMISMHSSTSCSCFMPSTSKSQVSRLSLDLNSLLLPGLAACGEVLLERHLRLYPTSASQTTLPGLALLEPTMLAGKGWGDGFSETLAAEAGTCMMDRVDPKPQSLSAASFAGGARTP